MMPVVPVDVRSPDLLRRIEEVWRGGGAALPAVEAGPPRTDAAPDGTALVVRTSGSTGRRLEVALPRTAVEASVAAGVERLGAAPGDRWGLALPLDHVAGLLVMLRARAVGGAVVRATDAGDPRALGRVDAEHLAVVPTQLVRCLRAGVDLGRFRTVLVGGGPLDPGTRADALARGVRVVESYGATETCGGCVYDGLPLAGVRVDVGADGTVRVGGPTLATGYLGDAATSAERFRDGWFTTGDVGRSVDGRLVVDGRRDDVAVSGGVNVALPAVAAALREAAGVADATAVGVTDPEWGTLVRAVVVAREGGSPSLAALREAVARRLPRTHAPRELLVVPSLDRDGLGKIGAGSRRALVDAPPTERLE